MTDIDDRETNETEAGGPSQPSHRGASPMENPTPMEVPSSKSTSLRGRNLVFPSPVAAEKVKPRRPFTRAAAKQNFPVKDDVAETSSQRRGKSKYFEQPIEIVDITTCNVPDHPCRATLCQRTLSLLSAEHTVTNPTSY
jgi:hypothetical protein